MTDLVLNFLRGDKALILVPLIVSRYSLDPLTRGFLYLGETKPTQTDATIYFWYTIFK